MEIASTVIAIAHILNFNVLAEGVETQEQLDFLNKKGCHSYQGYFKSKPLTSDAFSEFIKQR